MIFDLFIYLNYLLHIFPSCSIWEIKSLYFTGFGPFFLQNSIDHYIKTVMKPYMVLFRTNGIELFNGMLKVPFSWLNMNNYIKFHVKHVLSIVSNTDVQVKLYNHKFKKGHKAIKIHARVGLVLWPPFMTLATSFKYSLNVFLVLK
jgi:hypothetical protein